MSGGNAGTGSDQEASVISRVPARHTFQRSSNFAIALLSEAAAPALRFFARLRSSRKPSPPSEWRQGLLVGAGHIGDVLYNTGSIPFLKEGLPKCEWHFVAPPPANEVLKNNPYVSDPVAALESLPAAREIDAIICYNSSGYWRELLQASSLGIPNRIGYTHKGFSSLVTFPIRIRYPQPYPAYFRDLVGQIIGRSPDWALRPVIYPGAENEAKAEQVWNRANLKGNQDVVACFATSRQRLGVWPADKFAETIALLEAGSPAKTVLCGALADRSALEELKARFHLKASIVAGELDLLSLACLLRRCGLVLCPDSGPRHLANAVGTPVMFVRNVAVRRVETGTYCDTEIDLAPDLECVSSAAQARSFSFITPEDVAKKIRFRIQS
jgi:ADP-heptose:LPS heptosyltransferase